MTCLTGIRVLDLSRVFSGPWATQMLADFGADVIKVERPGLGDDVRYQGPRARDAQGQETRETSSFLSMNRGKRSITVDLTQPAGQALIRQLAQDSDVVIENFKAGHLRRFGLDYESLQSLNPRLVYCSISGFGQSGPYAHLPGYDPLFQSMSGLMSVTGQADGAPGGGPVRVGYSVSDITAGFYAANAIQAALLHRERISGQGQYIDLALLDAQVAAMSHVAMMYLLTGQQPQRLGNVSPITCPWQSFRCLDGEVVIAVGNDPQFVAFCQVLGLPHLSSDPRFLPNPLRVKHREVLIPLLAQRMAERSMQAWYDDCEQAGVPCGPINDFEHVFADPQIQHRQLRMQLPHPTIGELPQVANPIHFSATPVRYDRAPPLLGQHTEEVLRERLGLDEARIAELRREKVI